jgi:SAM-dependent methyltransferase
MKKMIFKYKNVLYPSYIKTGNACSFIAQTAKQFCVGDGLDIGGISGWVLPGARPINILIDDEYDAFNLPNKKFDYIFSSHTLEHLPKYIDAIEYWKSHIKNNGVLFLYLPHPDMEYWNPQNNRKHYHLFYPENIKKVLCDVGFKNVINSERDLYWSFSVVGFNKA